MSLQIHTQMLLRKFWVNLHYCGRAWNSCFGKRKVTCLKTRNLEGVYSKWIQMEETRESKSKGVPSNPVRLNCWTLLWKLASLVMLSGTWALLDRKDDLLARMKKKLQLVRMRRFYLGFFWVYFQLGNLKANDLNRIWIRSSKIS